MLEQFIQEFGYYAVFIFACIEGEIAVLTAGFLCRHGQMHLPYVMLFAFLGTMITEQILYFAGRAQGTKLLKKYPQMQERFGRVLEFLRKYDSYFIFGCRFVYGIRNISPIAIGVAGISPLKYSALNIPAAAVWAVSVAGAGYAFAHILTKVQNHMQYLQYTALILLLTAWGYFINKKKKRKKKKRKQQKD